MEFGCLIFWIIITNAASTGPKTRCEVPSVVKGKPANITCLFNEDVSQTKRSFSVYRYEEGNYQVVLKCFWINRSRPDCEAKKGYSLYEGVSRTLVLGLTSASEEFVGRYMCQVIPSDPADLQSCSFILKAPSSIKGNFTEENGGHSPGVIAGAVVGSVALVAVGMAVVYVFIRLRRRNFHPNKSAGSLACSSCYSQSDIHNSQDAIPLKYTCITDHATDPATKKDTSDLRPNQSSDSTELLNACQTGDIQKVKLLGSKCDVNARSKTGHTPLHVACTYDRVEVVKQLLQLGAQIEANDANGQTPLHAASFNGSSCVVQVLLERNGDVGSRDITGSSTLLHLACSKTQNETSDHSSLSTSGQCEQVVKLPLNARAEIESRDKQNRSPLHLACQNGMETVVKILLQRGSNIEAKDFDDATPLHLASENGNEAIVKVLIQKGAYIETRDAKGRTPLDLARGKGHQAVANVLSRQGRLPRFSSNLFCCLRRSDQRPENGPVEIREAPHPMGDTLVRQTESFRPLLQDYRSTANDPSPPVHNEATRADQKETPFQTEQLSHTAFCPENSATAPPAGNILSPLPGNSPSTQTLCTLSSQTVSTSSPLPTSAPFPQTISTPSSSTSSSALAISGAPSVPATRESLHPPERNPIQLQYNESHEGSKQQPYSSTPEKTRGRTERELDTELCQHQDVPPPLPPRTPIQSQDELLRACQENDFAKLCQLVKNGVNICCTDSEDKNPIHWVSINGSVEGTKLLTGSPGAESIVNDGDNNGHTPLHHACKGGEALDVRVNVAKLLLQTKASTAVIDNENRTPLHWACEKGNATLVRMLIEHKAFVEAKDNKGRTPLHVACRKGSKEVVEILCPFSDINAHDNQKWTPLHWACYTGKASAVRALLGGKSVDVNAKGEQDRTPLHVACLKGCKPIVRMLLDRGADRTAVDADGKKASQIATEKNLKEIVELLEKSDQ